MCGQDYGLFTVAEVAAVSPEFARRNVRILGLAEYFPDGDLVMERQRRLPAATGTFVRPGIPGSTPPTADRRMVLSCRMTGIRQPDTQSIPRD